MYWRTAASLGQIPYTVCKLKDLHLIITDDGVGESYKSKIIERGGHVEAVGVEQ